MSKAAAAKPAAEPGGDTPAAPKKGKKKLLMLAAIPVVLGLVGAGGWFSGILPPLLGMGHKPPVKEGADAAGPGEGAVKDGAEAAHAPIFAELPLIVANLNAPGKRPVFVKVTAKLEIARAEDAPIITAAMPRLLDLFQTYLRETRPEELQGAAGTWRLRQELMARANIAVSPAHVLDVLFTELLVQ